MKGRVEFSARSSFEKYAPNLLTGRESEAIALSLGAKRVKADVIFVKR